MYVHTKDKEGNERWSEVDIPPGTVTSVGLNMPPEFISNGPITSRGDLQVKKKPLQQGLVYATPAAHEGPLDPIQLQNEHLPVVDIKHGGTGARELPQGILVGAKTTLLSIAATSGYLHSADGTYSFKQISLDEARGVLSVDRGGTGATDKHTALRNIMPDPQSHKGDYFGVTDRGEMGWVRPSFAPVAKLSYKTFKLAYPADGEIFRSSDVRLSDGEHAHVVLYPAIPGGSAGFMLSYGSCKQKFFPKNNSRIACTLLRAGDLLIADCDGVVAKFPAVIDASPIVLSAFWEQAGEYISILGATSYIFR